MGRPPAVGLPSASMHHIGMEEVGRWGDPRRWDYRHLRLASVTGGFIFFLEKLTPVWPGLRCLVRPRSSGESRKGSDVSQNLFSERSLSVRPSELRQTQPLWTGPSRHRSRWCSTLDAFCGIMVSWSAAEIALVVHGSGVTSGSLTLQTLSSSTVLVEDAFRCVCASCVKEVFD